MVAIIAKSVWYTANMIYVALLRGINVGGNHKVEMAQLKILFEGLGCTEVRTYINSGNVIFKDERPINTLEPLIETAIEERFGFKVRIVLRDSQNIAMLCQEIPVDWTNGAEQKTDVMFLWEEVDSPDALSQLVIKPEIERVQYLPGAIIWNIDRENVARGSGVKIIGTDLYKHMTMRNINTVRKLHQLMQA